MAMATAMKATVSPGPRRLRTLLYWKFTSVLPLHPPKTDKPLSVEPYTNLFVEGLHKRTTSKGLRAAFSRFGEVVDAKVVRDPITRYSNGYGFVRYATTQEGYEWLSISRWSDYICRVCNAGPVSFYFQQCGRRSFEPNLNVMSENLDQIRAEF